MGNVVVSEGRMLEARDLPVLVGKSLQTSPQRVHLFLELKVMVNMLTLICICKKKELKIQKRERLLFLTQEIILGFMLKQVWK